MYPAYYIANSRMCHVIIKTKNKKTSSQENSQWILATILVDWPRNCLNRAMRTRSVKGIGAQQVPMVKAATGLAQGADAFSTVSQRGGDQRGT